ncbi:Enzymatic polyprotein [Sesamum angolense]|uniref:Enzymatic polyprotein n=1 Tax=Sesamum angolense TaxID=2727404 RepID=A0AAE2BVF4_9LAMI|nr:Enzymatic polyprotein [Sesamum angolense]
MVVQTKARTYKSGQRSGPTRASSQGSRRTDTRSTGRTPTKRTFRRAHTRTNESFKDCNCWTCGARGHIAPDCPQKRGEIRKFEATDDILDAVYYGELNSHDEEDRLQTSESLSGFFSRMTVSNKTMERIMRQDSNLSPYDGFRNWRNRKEYIEIPRIFKEFAKVMAPDPIRIPRIGSGICTAKPGVFPKEARETLPVIAGRDFSQKILILNTGIREAKIMIGEHLERPGSGKRGDFDAKLTNPKMQDKRKFGKVLLSFRQQGLIDSDSFTRNLRKKSRTSGKPWNKIEATLKIKEECKYEYVRYKPIQMNMEDKKDMQIIIKEHISLGLIEPGISAYSSPGFLGLVLSEKKATIAVNKIEFLGILIDEAGIELQEHIVEKIRNFPNVLKDKKQLQSFLGVVNFAGIFIKDLAKYRKDFRPLLKETESAKWKWEEIHTQRVRELNRFAIICQSLQYRRTREIGSIHRRQ